MARAGRRARPDAVGARQGGSTEPDEARVKARDKAKERSLLARAYAYGRTYRWRFFLLLSLIGSSLAVALLQPRFLGSALDAIIAKDLSRTYVFLAAMLAAIVLQGAVSKPRPTSRPGFQVRSCGKSRANFTPGWCLLPSRSSTALGRVSSCHG